MSNDSINPPKIKITGPRYSHVVRPAAHVDGHVTPVKHADGHVTPVKHADGHVTPVKHADGHITPVKNVHGKDSQEDGHVTPVKNVHGKDSQEDGHVTPVKNVHGKDSQEDGHVTPVKNVHGKNSQEDGHVTPVKNIHGKDSQEDGHVTPIKNVHGKDSQEDGHVAPVKHAPVKHHVHGKDSHEDGHGTPVKHRVHGKEGRHEDGHVSPVNHLHGKGRRHEDGHVSPIRHVHGKDSHEDGNVTPVRDGSNSLERKSSPRKKHTLGVDIMPPPQVLHRGGKKITLEPGHSHLDWMNLQKASMSNQGIVDGRPNETISVPIIHAPETRFISPDELKLHNKKTDCWIALRGHVYDITTYIKFHPGGVDQILKGAGIDATTIFNAIHRYVNFETILKGKQVGIYTKNESMIEIRGNKSAGTISHRDIQGSSNLGERRRDQCWGCKICNFCLANDNSVQLLPHTEFTENEQYVFLKVNSRGLRRNKEYWTVGILNSEILLLKLITKPPDMWVAHFKLTDKLEDDTGKKIIKDTNRILVSVSFTNTYKNIMLRLKKPQLLEWRGLGQPLSEHNEIIDSRSIVEDMHQGTVRINEEIAQTLYFIAIQLPLSVLIGVPVGFDVKVRINGVARRYTPVHPIFLKHWKTNDLKYQFIYLVYRMYPDGEMTPKLKNLQIDDNTSLTIGCSAGNFDTTWLQSADSYFLLAGGSGITPYFRILEFIREHNIALGLSHVVLMYWNRFEQEIVWKNDFENLEKNYRWFHFIPILTKPNEQWEGISGRISCDILQTCMNSIKGLTKNKKRIKFMSCGSDGFNTSAFEAIEGIGFHSENLFTFLG